MLNGMDLDAELEGDQDGGLMQEIGEECSEKVSHGPLFARKKNSDSKQYGRVERVYVSRDSGPPMPVFVKFTNQLSALRVSFICLREPTRLF